MVAALAPRQFLLAGARVGAPRVIASRWAMSYLRGPLALAELRPLLAAAGAPAPVRTATPAASAGAPVLPGVTQLFASGGSLVPHVVVEAEVVYRRATPAIERRVSGYWCAPFAAGRVAWENVRPIGGVLNAQAPAGASLAALPDGVTTALSEAAKQFSGEMDSRAIEVSWHSTLRLVQEEGEPLSLFAERCRQAAPDGAGKEAEVCRRYEDRLHALDEHLAKEQLVLADDEREAAARVRDKNVAVATGIGETVLSAVLGALSGRRSSVGSTLRRGASTARAYSSKDRMADRAEADVEQVQQTIAQLEADRQRLASELEQARATLRQTGAGDGIETLRLTPAHKDIAVRRVALGWLPQGGA
jgi:hypothetical protein